MSKALLFAFLGTLFTFSMTTLGSAVVFLFKDEPNDKFNRIFLGFSAGIMVSASIFSLILPAIEMSREQGVAVWIPTAFGMLLGVLFLFILNHVVPHKHIESNIVEGVKSKLDNTMLFALAVTLHNIPEGMAVGLAFALFGEGSASIASAIALAIGIGIQNFPEGAAISLPLRAQGISKKKAFSIGSFTGIVEPIFGVLVVLISKYIAPYMPWVLSFAAGAMIYVTVEELIPESTLGEHSELGSFSFILGFIIMMILDISL